MDVHPTKNGINTYWSIPKYLNPSTGTEVLNHPTALAPGKKTHLSTPIDLHGKVFKHWGCFWTQNTIVWYCLCWFTSWWQKNTPEPAFAWYIYIYIIIYIYHILYYIYILYFIILYYLILYIIINYTYVYSEHKACLWRSSSQSLT